MNLRKKKKALKRAGQYTAASLMRTISRLRRAAYSCRMARNRGRVAVPRDENGRRIDCGLNIGLVGPLTGEFSN